MPGEGTTRGQGGLQRQRRAPKQERECYDGTRPRFRNYDGASEPTRNEGGARRDGFERVEDARRNVGLLSGVEF